MLWGSWDFCCPFFSEILSEFWVLNFLSRSSFLVKPGNWKTKKFSENSRRTASHKKNWLPKNTSTGSTSRNRNILPSATMEQIFCNACSYGIDDPVVRASHYKTEWHRYNVKRRCAGLQGIPQGLFEQKIAGAYVDINVLAPRCLHTSWWL